MRLRVDLHCRGAYVDAYAEHALPLRVESFAFSAVTQNGDRRMAAAVPVFGLIAIVARDVLLCGLARRVAVEIRVTAHGVRVEATLGL